ncbi:Sec-independent protein translocase protein TatB [Colwellia sp. RSH04]|uniref:Sec-independent protein translocase protein TatB n=1 Tax=Colwellia sp. RSH04 TaxID=2305464 RepID=UPI000E5728E1|nr:Sec-independent protein translocase protein TatB [Colwellia sp. RSH04]RHW75843.1 Sec-independent protein translocase subunit TatB [Colwellia sp. RSH04]
MFDIGFWELMIIGIMGLVILGPERLPVAIRTIRGWIGGVRKFSDAVKTELTEELRINELHANLKKAEQADMKNLSPEVAESLKSLQEATDMVTEPFKKVNTEPLDSMISSSLAGSSKASAQQEPAVDSEKNEVQHESEAAQIESPEKPK